MVLCSCAVVFKFLGPSATVVCAGLIAGQNYLYRKEAGGDAKELKSDINELRKDMHNMENKPQAEIKRIGGKERIDWLEAREEKSSNRVEGLNTKMEKMGIGTEETGSSVLW